MQLRSFSLMKLLSIQVGSPRIVGDASASSSEERQWTTGFYKLPVEGAVVVGRLGLAGDGQADLKNHGGIDKAICAYPREHLNFWERELCVTLHNGAFGENISLAGLVEDAVCVGDVFACGTAVL